MREFHSSLIRPPFYRFPDIDCNCGVALPNTHQHNLNSSHHPLLARPQLRNLIISHRRVPLHLLCPLSSAESMLRAIRHHQNSTSQLHRPRPRTIYQRPNKPWSQVWPHRRFFNGSVALSGRPSRHNYHQVKHHLPMVVLQLGMWTRSVVSSKEKQF